MLRALPLRLPPTLCCHAPAFRSGPCMTTGIPAPVTTSLLLEALLGSAFRSVGVPSTVLLQDGELFAAPTTKTLAAVASLELSALLPLGAPRRLCVMTPALCSCPCMATGIAAPVATSALLPTWVLTICHVGLLSIPSDEGLSTLGSSSACCVGD